MIIITAALIAFSLSMVSVEADETELTEEFMTNDENIELGKTLFQKRCKFCHGKGAYPGKAPKLKPKKLTAEQVYLRVSYGFRAMPGWEHEFRRSREDVADRLHQKPGFLELEG